MTAVKDEIMWSLPLEYPDGLSGSQDILAALTLPTDSQDEKLSVLTAKEVMWSPPNGYHGGRSQEFLTALDLPPDAQLPHLVVLSEDLQTEQWTQDDEATVDVAQLQRPRDPVAPQAPLVPVTPLGSPTRVNHSGVYNFEVQINGRDTNKQKYLYSHLCNRIYVDMGVEFPVQFTWDWDAARRPLFVRATTAFSDESQAEKRVERCLQHVHPTNNAASGAICHHVLQSTRPLGTDGVHYCGAPGDPRAWYSVAVRFAARPDAGAESFAHAYSFNCKNTCGSGINRRGIEVVFTLEDERGTTYGRQAVGVRVCSCPRRDLKKDEEAAEKMSGKRRRAPAHAAPPAHGKRVKVEPEADDLAVYTLPKNLQIVGRKTFETGLTVILNDMLVRANKCADEQQFQLYSTSIGQVEKLLEQVRSGERD